MDKSYVYILTNQQHTVFYVGVTTNLVKRMIEHKRKIYQGFTCKYNVDKLVYYERLYDVNEAIKKEKQMKKWKRKWKTEMIEQMNPDWVNLFAYDSDELYCNIIPSFKSEPFA